ncbi:MAG: hypothetical protein M3M98_05600, partial [Nitrospirota bacterium]|nr:hypothetical protein [Nitrospirota bacterium]
MAESLRFQSLRMLMVTLLCCAMSTACEAADKITGTLTVKDALTLPNQTVRIEARLTGKTPAAAPAWGGVALQLHIDGKPVGLAKTNEGGQAIFAYTPKMRGTNVISVSIDDGA